MQAAVCFGCRLQQPFRVAAGRKTAGSADVWTMFVHC